MTNNNNTTSSYYHPRLFVRMAHASRRRGRRIFLVLDSQYVPGRTDIILTCKDIVSGEKLEIASGAVITVSVDVAKNHLEKKIREAQNSLAVMNEIMSEFVDESIYNEV